MPYTSLSPCIPGSFRLCANMTLLVCCKQKAKDSFCWAVFQFLARQVSSQWFLPHSQCLLDKLHAPHPQQPVLAEAERVAVGVQQT